MASGFIPTVGPSAGASVTDSHWKMAFDKLDDDLKSTLGSISTNKLDVLDAVIKSAKDKRQLCLRERWTYKAPGGKVIVLRDVLEKTIGWINKYKAVGDIAVQYDPVHAALPWAAFQSLLIAECSDVQIFGVVVTSIEIISRIIYRCRLYEDMYLRRQFEIQGMLEDVLIQMYSETLTILSKTINYLQKSTAARVISSAFQPTNGGEATKNITALEDEVLKLAALADTKTIQIIDTKTTQLGDDTRHMLQHLNTNFSRVMDTTLSVKSYVDEKKRAELLDWLSSVPISIHHKLASTERIPDTETWLMGHSEFQQWLAASFSSVLLIHGVRGCGKSTLFSAVIDCFLRQPGTGPPPAPCAYFYCANILSEPARAAPDEILRSIVRQLSVDLNDGTIDQHVLSAYDARTKDARKNEIGLAKLEVSECVSLLQNLTTNNPAYIAIDNIDELYEEDRAKLLEALEQVAAGSTSVIKVLLTSRDNTHIEALLESATKIRISPDGNNRIVKIFVQKQLDTAIRRRRILNGKVSSSLRQRLSDALILGAGEMFLWVKLQLDFLCRKKAKHDIITAIEQGLSSDLDALYGQAFDQIFSPDNNAEKKDVAKLVAQQLFSWLLFSRRPMTIEATRAALSTDQDIHLLGSDDLVDMCFNLIMVDSELGVFRFCHPSARDFMQQKVIFTSTTANQLLATACIRQCKIGQERFSFTSDESPVKDFYNYAAVYWPDHMRLSGITSRADSGAALEMSSFVFKGRQGTINPAFSVWIDWTSQVSLILPLYHPLRGVFEPLQSYGISPLFVSCVFGLPGLLDRTLELVPNINLDEKNNTGYTGVYLACAYGHASVVSRLIEAKADPNVKCGAYGSPMHVACFRGHEDVVRVLLRNGVLAQAPGTFSSPFEAACRGGHERVATLFVKEQATIQTMEDYENMLRQAIVAGFRDLVEWLTQPTTLISLGISHPDVDWEKQSVGVAIREGRPLILQSILQSKPYLKDALPNDGIATAAHFGHTDMVTYLHSLGMSIEAEGTFGSPLRCASLIGNERIVELLLMWGVDVKACGAQGDALHAAAQNGHTQIMRMLVAEGAQVDHTSLQVAAYHGHEDAVRYLIRKGADIYCEGEYKDALHAAAEGGHAGMGRLLISEGYRRDEYPDISSMPPMLARRSFTLGIPRFMPARHFTRRISKLRKRLWNKMLSPFRRGSL
ncbi:hypothetical protein F4821DRAFT_26052 [Hypoxylon rubiginosum]|uniref:Uncharacterized protein n=1 Tax=Hypoxylon rubiginosum TaxID=110542 RepID=A0ACC0CM63_9PEZI|nr:hypothetical protein F4821DRAFT_26052 [Hypoxylon rubiginosum]